MSYFNIVTETTENTVVTEYKPDGNRVESYQNEAELEREFTELLRAQGYEYLPIHTETDLIVNLRRRLEALNNYAFSNEEWTRFFSRSTCQSQRGY